MLTGLNNTIAERRCASEYRKSTTIFCSQYADNEWYNQLGGEDHPLTEATLDRIIHDAYRIDIRSMTPGKDVSMREVYGLHDD